LKKFLIIQTAFIGDVILATSIVEKLVAFFPNSQIDFLLRKGNENLLANNPIINQVLIWDKKNNKYDNLRNLSKQIHAIHYNYVINLQRFASSGLITSFSGAEEKRGFKSNPLSFCFTKKFKHKIGDGTHEIERNHQLIKDLTDLQPALPRLYPTNADFKTVEQYKNNNYVCFAPTSVWFTKQLPAKKWVALASKIKDNTTIYLLGGASDKTACEEIAKHTKNRNVINLAGKLSFLASAALMQNAQMNYVNDSAPLHIASAINAPVTAFFCSTLPSFGFTPLSTNSTIIEIKEKLTCRPCGLHGKKKCPEGHFNCGEKIII